MTWAKASEQALSRPPKKAIRGLIRTKIDASQLRSRHSQAQSGYEKCLEFRAFYMTATYLCFAPDDATAKKAIRLLRHYRIDDHFIGLIGDVDLVLDVVSVEEESQTWEALDVLQRSVAIGGAPGIFDGLHAVSLPSVATTLAGSAIFAADCAGIGVAAVLSRALGKSLDPDTIADLCRRLADGELLLAVRLTDRHATHIGQQLRRQVPALRCEGNFLAPEQEVQRA